MSSGYFSEREGVRRARVHEVIPENVWRGVQSVIQARLEDASFGAGFPDMCADGMGPCGVNSRAFRTRLGAEHPNVSLKSDAPVPDTLSILDVLEFCHASVGKPEKGDWHSYQRHHHLDWDVPSGQLLFREEINRIFSRNGIAFEIGDDGLAKRIAPPVLAEALKSAVFITGDSDLDALLEAARRKFTSPDPAVRAEALEKLWDAFERLKTIEPGRDKRAQADALLTRAVPTPELRGRVEAEMVELTQIGNAFRIRHSETTKTPITRSLDIDYLFHRCFAMVTLLLAATGRMR